MWEIEKNIDGNNENCSRNDNVEYKTEALNE